MSDLPDPIETEKAVDAMELLYPSALECYREAFQNKTINLETFAGLVIDFMKMPPPAREEADTTIRKLRQEGEMKRPEGVSSGIALQVQHEAEMARIQKEYVRKSPVHTGKLQDKLTRQLFFTDPEIRDFVGKQMDVGESFVVGSYWHKRFSEGMEKAWSMAHEQHTRRDDDGVEIPMGWKHPRERAWLERCHTRACAMMNHDPDLR